MCPPGTEPLALEGDQGGCKTDVSDGWCCVTAPASSCSDAAGVICVTGDECAGCFTAASDPTLTCEAGRVCCLDMCD